MKQTPRKTVGTKISGKRSQAGRGKKMPYKGTFDRSSKTHFKTM